MFRVPSWVLLLSLCRAASAATEDYTFETYVKEFGKVYESLAETETRRAIFESNLYEIQQRSAVNRKGHFLAVNEWTDRRVPDEMPLGLQKKRHGFSDLGYLKGKKTPEVEEFYHNWMATTVPVSELPKEVDWRTHDPKVTTAVKNQGFCGSCWAFASTAVLESNIALQTGKLFTLSPQELVSCVEDPEHCGGSGGCDGAIYELAFDYAKNHGMVTEDDFPYKSKTGGSVKCSLKNETDGGLSLRGASGESGYLEGAVATIDGYINFPTNNYTALMNAVATLGPIGVTVAATPWSFYGGGVFTHKDHHSHAATDVNHAVVLEGYGVDQESQEPFWLVRNSWGANWGEGGYIRLKRVDPSTVEDFDEEDCGTDYNPADGAACTKDKDGNDIVPDPVKVCGTTAILYDTFVPVGGRLLSNSVSAMEA